jgi:hypothetical protein
VAEQIALAREQLAARPGDLVVHRIGIVGAQDFAGGLGQVELHLAVVDRDQLRQRLGVVFQRAVKRFVGNALRHQPGQRQAHGPEQEQWRKHPVEDFAKQGALLALEDFQARGPE